MRFRRRVLKEIAGHIRRLGLSRCPVCGGESSLAASRLPAIINCGGWPHERDDPRHDPDAYVWFAVKVECDSCGHMLLFNSERFRHGDEPVFVVGFREHEDEVDPRDD
jgi:ssDNA-binding Zn-finger/Zn-ribbon topoisomerase 1